MNIYGQAEEYAAGVIMGGSDFARDVRNQVREAYLAGHQAASLRPIITTAEELDALPIGSVVRAKHLPYIKRGPQVWLGARGINVSSLTLSGFAPLNLLFYPEEEL